MLMVDKLVFASPGFGSIPAINNNIAKNTFLHCLAEMGTKKYFVLLCLKHNKFWAVSNSLAHGLLL
jgi:hypothetical protein